MNTKTTDPSFFFITRLQKPVQLTFTNNTRSMISFRKDNSGGIILRLHNMFQQAPTEVLSAIANWIQKPGSQPVLVKTFMQQNRIQMRSPVLGKPGMIKLQNKGKYHDLEAIFAHLNAEYFSSQIEMHITWGKRSCKRYPRTLRLGSYTQEDGLITISPRLDRRSVPGYFVEYVVFHEMLHAAIGVETDQNGRRRIHTAKFKQLEKRFRYFQRAIDFEQKFFG